MGVLFDEALAAHNVEAAALLHQGDGHQVVQLLLRDVFADGTGRGPHVLEPLPDILTLRRLPGRGMREDISVPGRPKKE